MKNILLLEDNATDVKNVSNALDLLHADYKLHVAGNDVDALAFLNGSAANDVKILPDIILLDLSMPQMNGLEFLGIIKNYYSLKNIKIYVMTASAVVPDMVIAKSLGIKGYVLKPLDFSSRAKDVFSKASASLKEDLCGKEKRMLFPFFAIGSRPAYDPGQPSFFQKFFPRRSIVTPRLLLLCFAVSTGLGFIVYRQSRLPVKKAPQFVPVQKLLPPVVKTNIEEKTVPVHENVPVIVKSMHKIPPVIKPVAIADTVPRALGPKPSKKRHGIGVIKINHADTGQSAQQGDSTTY